MRLYEDGLLDIESPVADVLRYFGSQGKEAIRIRNLLAHNSGFPPGVGYLPPGADESNVLATIKARSLAYTTGGPPVYSDVGFIVLGKALERITRKKLDRLCGTYLSAGIGIRETSFCPDSAVRHRCAPTVVDPAHQGVVHDPTARRMNGVAGHAGLFSTLNDLILFARTILCERRYFQPESVRLFTTRAIENGSRALGWDTNWKHESSAGSTWPENAFGHTGFTGTSIWLDPNSRTFAILLTNMVYETRPNDDQVREFRLAYHSAVAQCLGGFVR